MQSEIESIKRLKNPKSKVSCHYLIIVVKDKKLACRKIEMEKFYQSQ